MRIAVMIWLIALPALAQPQTDEARAERVFSELRCMVCAGESVAGSDAQLARDMRSLVRSRIAAGEDDRAILRYLSSRYGEAILLDPPLERRTLPLWFAPASLLLVGAVLLWQKRRSP